MNKSKTINIYYHTDFDGILSAVLVSIYLKEHGYKSRIVKPLELMEKEKLNKLRFKKPFAIVDFPYNQKAFAYFDHHSSNEPEQISGETKYWAFDGKSKSCARVIFSLLKKKTKDLEKIVELCDIVDSASYVEKGISVDEILFPKSPVLILNRALEIAKKDFKIKFWNSIVEKIIKNQPLGKIVNGKKIQEYYKQALKNQENALNALNEKAVYHKNTGLVTYDTTGKNWSRYGLASIYPNSVIWLGLRTVVKGFVDISMGQNPWNLKTKTALENIHIGNILKKYNGGGHKYVGSARFDSYEKAKNALEQIKKEIEEKIVLV